jgi:hypothetical protein
LKHRAKSAAAEEKPVPAPLAALRHHVTGAIERGEAEAVVEKPKRALPFIPRGEAKVANENFDLDHPPADIGIRQSVREFVDGLPDKHQQFARDLWDWYQKGGINGEDQAPSEKGVPKDAADAIDRQLHDLWKKSQPEQTQAAPEPAKTPAETAKPETSEPKNRIHALVDRFEKALADKSLPTDPRELREMAKQTVGGDPTSYVDDIYDSLEGAINREFRKAVAADDPKTLKDRIELAKQFEDALGRRTRTLEITERQQFSTPLTISQAAGYAADVQGEGERVLEPTAGTGNLVEPVRDKANVFTSEIEHRRADVLRANGYRNVVEGDFLKSTLSHFGAVITNPPWGKISSGRYRALDVPAPWGNYGDVSERFLVSAMNRLDKDGRMVAVMPTTVLGPASNGFRKWIEQNHTLRAIIQSPPGAYDRRGTSVDSLLMVIDKGKVPDAPEPIIRVQSNQPKNWAEYADAVKPLAEGGSHARAVEEPAATPTRNNNPAVEQEQPRRTGAGEAPLGVAGPERPASADTGTGSREGLPDVRPGEPGPRDAGQDRTGMGSDVVPENQDAASVDSPGADGEINGATAPRLVRQSSGALRPRGVAPEREREFDEASSSPIFTPYVLRSGVSGNPHPRQIVETRSLAGAPAPEVTYKPSQRVLDAHSRKAISDEQFDSVAAAGQADQRGHAMMIADDVGVGKSREIAARALDLFDQGRKRILITSKAENNLKDLEDEMRIVSGVGKDDPLPFKVIYLRDFKDAAERAQKKSEYQAIPAFDNAVYLVEAHNLTPYRRAIQDLQVDSLLADEVHTYKNKDAGLGQTWSGLHKEWLARKIPITYFSATPGATIDDLEYLYGLREWTHDGFRDWVARKTGNSTEEQQKQRGEQDKNLPQDISQQVGVDSTEVSKNPREEAQRRRQASDSFRITVSTAEMEQIMRELKMKGKYYARDLWRGGVEFEGKETELSGKEQKDWEKAVNYMRDVERAFNLYANENEAMRKGFGITGLLQFAAKRRMFDFRLPRAIDEAKGALGRGEQPVISVINVNETKEGEGYMAACLNAINVNKILVDDDGNVEDLGEIPEAVAHKNELIERQAEEFPNSPDPIAEIQKAFGKNNVAVVTGAESAKDRRKMMEDFQKGIKKVAIISGAGKTGISLHHVLETGQGAKGKRHLVLADYEWSATNFKQELGRVDRAGQLTPPKITALTLGSAAEKKFIATIANRMKTLGAVSKGAAESTGATALENFELGGDLDNQAMRDAWRGMPRELRSWFRGRKFNEVLQDGTPVPKSSIQGAELRDFLLQLQLMPIDVGNQVWDHFWKTREEMMTGDAVAEAQARKTAKSKGEILRVHDLKPDLQMYEVKDAEGHRAGILSGMVTDYMPTIQNYLDSRDETVNDGGMNIRVSRKSREYVNFQGPNGELVSGLKLRPGQVQPLAKALGKSILYQHTPESALTDLRSGDTLPLDNGWTLRLGKGGERKGYIIIDGAKLSNTDRGKAIMPHGAKYNAVSGGFFYLPEDDDTVKSFLNRFPIKKTLTKDAQEELKPEDTASVSSPLDRANGEEIAQSSGPNSSLPSFLRGRKTQPEGQGPGVPGFLRRGIVS